MSTHRWKEVREVFETACDLDALERESFLSKACAGDTQLRAEVESILAGNERAPPFFDAPAAEAFPELFDVEQVTTLVGRCIGPYRLIRFVASGGMGAVYQAARADRQCDKKVAIKLIKRRVVTEDTLRRFRTERQALAMLDHPNIARLRDGGVTHDGLPYLVMEYVDGTPIDRFCDRQKLSTLERLRLFQTVSQAVQYAHHHLIVHRDLKPNNILVTSEGIPKLLDFGIAKVLDSQEDPHADTRTATGQRLMTPEYASPEQICGKSITTATDVYSLGVVLYELLTGHHPYRTKSRSPHEMERTICEQDPEKPSTAIGRVEQVVTAGGSSRTTLTPELVSQTRDGQPDKLRRRLAGDLDAIVLMAMRKEPRHRYPSVEQFSQDIRRHLDGLPVTARKGTFRYRSAKFIRRNRAAVIATVVVAVALVGGIVGTTWQSQIAAGERDKAIQSQRQAQQQALKAERVNAFLQDMLASADPNNAPANDATARDIIDEAANRIEQGALREQPQVEAAVRITLGETYLQFGLYDQAERHLNAAMEIRERELDDGHPDVAQSLNSLGLLAKARGNYPEAERLYRRALELRRTTLGEEHTAVAETMNNLGVVLKKMSRWTEAEALSRKALDIRRAILGDRHQDVATSLTNLAAVLKNRGELAEAEPLYREAQGIFREVFGDQHYRVAVCLNNLALLLAEMDRYDESELLLREALAIRLEVFGEEHPAVATGLKNLALILTSKGESVEAESLYRRALTIGRKLQGDEHPSLANTLNNLAELLATRGEYDEAESLCRQALAIRLSKLPEGHPRIAGSLLALGRIRIGRNDPAGAEPLLRQAVAIYENKMPEGHRKTAQARSELGYCLVALEQYEQAEQILRDSYVRISDAQGQDHPVTRETLKQIIRLYEAWDKPEEAARYQQILKP